ncbi:MAG: PorT family protein [Fibromonadales bacterium]|nr:PorT family protein [Fibromonadales bacterium]
MNRFISIAMIIALTAVFAFSHGKSTRLGARAAFNMSTTVLEKGMKNEFGGGWEAGLLAGIPIAGTMTFNPGLNFVYRQPVNLKSYNRHEYAISAPFLIQIMPFGGPIFYANGGLQVDFPFSFQSRKGATTFYYDDRAPVDVGAVAGAGLFLAGERVAIDWKVSLGLMDYDSKNRNHNYGKLFQSALGLVY